MTPQEILATLPYAGFLGLTAEPEAETCLTVMPFATHLIGNPTLPALHGGATAALLEITATVRVAMTYPGPRLPRPINVTVSYLRTGRPLDVRARATISRAGRRVAHVEAIAWQEAQDQPIASLTAHFLLNDNTFNL
jgi:uncharacterized protein (TIGR00369 family)